MKIILLSLTIAAITLFTLACKYQKYTTGNLPEKQIRWGNGGGFVGKETSHILLENGQIFSQDIMGNTTAVGKTKAKKAKDLFKTITSPELAKMEYNHPGNLYSFLEFKDCDSLSRLLWGDKNIPVEKSIENLFEELNGLLKK